MRGSSPASNSPPWKFKEDVSDHWNKNEQSASSFSSNWIDQNPSQIVSHRNVASYANLAVRYVWPLCERDHQSFPPKYMTTASGCHSPSILVVLGRSLRRSLKIHMMQCIQHSLSLAATARDTSWTLPRAIKMIKSNNLASFSRVSENYPEIGSTNHGMVRQQNSPRRHSKRPPLHSMKCCESLHRKLWPPVLAKPDLHLGVPHSPRR